MVSLRLGSAASSGLPAEPMQGEFPKGQRLNGKQKAILTIGFVLILATGLFPPWVQSWNFVAEGEDLRLRIEPGAEAYSWIFQPPGVPAWVERSFRAPDDKEVQAVREITESGMRVLLKSVRMPGPWRSRIDTTRLLIEWAIVIAGVFAGFVCTAGTSEFSRTSSKPSMQGPE
jgi:hypothetical protein